MDPFQKAQRDRHLRDGWDDPAEHEEPAGVSARPGEAGARRSPAGRQ